MRSSDKLEIRWRKWSWSVGRLRWETSVSAAQENFDLFMSFVLLFRFRPHKNSRTTSSRILHIKRPTLETCPISGELELYWGFPKSNAGVLNEARIGKNEWKILFSNLTLFLFFRPVYEVDKQNRDRRVKVTGVVQFLDFFRAIDRWQGENGESLHKEYVFLVLVDAGKYYRKNRFWSSRNPTNLFISSIGEPLKSYLDSKIKTPKQHHVFFANFIQKVISIYILLENVFKFQHVDLHYGQFLIKPLMGRSSIDYAVDFDVILCDYEHSRIEIPYSRTILFNPFSNGNEIFEVDDNLVQLSSMANGVERYRGPPSRSRPQSNYTIKMNAVIEWNERKRAKNIKAGKNRNFQVRGLKDIF